MNFNNLKINTGASLAPMAGLTDNVTRELCAKYGANYTVSEMVSAKALHYGDRKTESLCKNTATTDCPYGIQLFGSDPEIMAEAAQKIMKFRPDFIDVNMGCPAPKITNNGCGSALMKTPKLCGEIVNALVKAVNVPITVKIRGGFDENYMTAVEVAKEVEFNGCSAIAIHGRTRAQMYHPPIHHNYIKEVKNAVSIPIIGNGDILTLEDAQNMIDLTGCDSLMIGRGAMGRPWFFAQIKAYLEGNEIPEEPTLKEKMNIMKKQVYDCCNIKGEEQAMRECRSQVMWYLQGLSGASKLRSYTSSLTYYTDIEDLANLALQLNR